MFKNTTCLAFSGLAVQSEKNEYVRTGSNQSLQEQGALGCRVVA